MRLRKDFSKPKALFVEGLDEVNVIGSITASLGIQDVDCVDVGGKDKLATNLPNAVKEASFLGSVKSFAVIQDADEDPKAAFERVTNLLRKIGMPCPDRPGTYATTGRFRVGVLILPGGNRNGYLEDVFLEAHSGTEELNCVDAFGQCCTKAGRPAFDSKRRAYALMVALEAPEPRLGRAFESGKINADSKAYDALKDFVRAL